MGVLSFAACPGEASLLASRSIPGGTNGDVQVELRLLSQPAFAGPGAGEENFRVEVLEELDTATVG